jgi:dTDP-4-dehydrorhamnose 3,5-epimerase
MEFRELLVAGAFLLDLVRHEDPRGDFVKYYHQDSFLAHGLDISFVEDFYSRSRRGVLRGMHFQAPPHAHWKLVTCLEGEILDVGFDMRRRSPTFGQWFEQTLSAGTPQAILLPPGIAHGFLALSDQSLVLYKTSTIHHPESEGGILWNSFGCLWPVDSPILSARDADLPPWTALRDTPLLQATWP